MNTKLLLNADGDVEILHQHTNIENTGTKQIKLATVHHNPDSHVIAQKMSASNSMYNALISIRESLPLIYSSLTQNQRTLISLNMIEIDDAIKKAQTNMVYEAIDTPISKFNEGDEIIYNGDKFVITQKNKDISHPESVIDVIITSIQDIPNHAVSVHQIALYPQTKVSKLAK